MAYESAKDKEIKTWKHEDGLYVSLFQYNGGEPKVQIGPRSYTKTDGSEGLGKTGRSVLYRLVRRTLHSMDPRNLRRLRRAAFGSPGALDFRNRGFHLPRPQGMIKII